LRNHNLLLEQASILLLFVINLVSVNVYFLVGIIPIFVIDKSEALGNVLGSHCLDTLGVIAI